MGRVPFGKSTWTILFALILIVAFVDLAFTFIAWYHSYWGLFGRIHYAAVTFAVWAFIWFVNYWHLLTW
jgi:hypothetical protein